MFVAKRLRRLPAIAFIALPLMSGAALAETLRIEGITVEGPAGLRVAVPEIVVTDSSLGEGAIRALFGPDYASALAGLAELDATEVRIPAITLTTEVPADGDSSATPAVADTTYRDLVLVAVENGVVTGGASVGSTEISVDGTNSLLFGSMSFDYLDLGGILGLYGIGARADAADSEMQLVYSNFRLDGILFGGDDFRCTVGPATADEFRARPLTVSLDQLIGAIQALEEAEQSSSGPPPSAIDTVVSYYVDFLTSFESTPVEIGQLDCGGATPDGRSLNFSMGNARMGGFYPGIYPDLAVNNISVEADDGWMRLGNFTWKPIDLSGPIAAVRAAEAPIGAEWFEANWRKLIPAIEGLSLSGFAMDVPSMDGGDNRVAASVGAVDVTLGAYVNGIPTDVSTSGAEIVIAVPDDEAGALFKAMGLDALSLDYDLAAVWNERDATIEIRQVAVGGRDLGRISLSGTLANAGADLFSEDENAMAAAAEALTVRDLRLEIENAGVVPALLAIAAAEQGVPPAALAAQFVAVARALPIGILGATDEALGLGRALADFMTGTPNLTVTLTAVDPRGVPVDVFVAAQENPEVLKDAFSVHAVADGEAVPFTFPDFAAAGDAEDPVTTDKQDDKN